MKSKSPPPSKALRHVYHAVYLQFLVGIVALVLPRNGISHIRVDPAVHPFGCAFLLLGINIWLYLRRYEKALRDEVRERKVEGGPER